MATLDLLVGATAADLSAQPGHLWMGFPLLEVQMAGIGDGSAASCSCEFRRSKTQHPCGCVPTPAPQDVDDSLAMSFWYSGLSAENT